MKGPTVGEMRTRIKFLSTTYAQDTYASTIATSETVTTVWGKVEYSSGNIFQQVGADHWRQRVKITVRANGLINTRLKAEFKGSRYDIEAIEPVVFGKAHYFVIRLGAEQKVVVEEDTPENSGVPIGDADEIGTLDPTPSGRFYTVDLHNVLNTTMSFYLDKKASVDWGDGTPIKQYPGDHLIHKVYDTDDQPKQVKVWWEVEPLNPCTLIYVQSGGETVNTAIVDEVAGDFPTDLWRFQVSNGLPVFPFAKIPDSITYVNVNQASLDTDTVNGIFQMYIDKNVTNGLLKVKQNPPVTDFNPSLLQAVEDLGTTVEYDF